MGQLDGAMSRPDLERRLDGALARRLTTIVAATGYGKSTLLAQWVPAVDGVLVTLEADHRDVGRLAADVVAFLRLQVPDLPINLPGANPSGPGPSAPDHEPARAESLAGLLAERLRRHLSRDVVLALDELDLLADATASLRFVEALVRSAPPRCHLVTASRHPVPFPIERLRRDNDLVELDASDLALTPGEVSTWCVERLGGSAARLGPSLHASTGGWPIAVHAALARLATTDPEDWAEAVEGAAATSDGLDQVVRDNFHDLPSDTRRLLRAGVVLPRLTVRLAASVGVGTAALPALAADGLFVRAVDDGYRLTPVARTVVGDQDDEATEIVRQGVAWYVERGMEVDALRAASAVDADLTHRLLVDHQQVLATHPGDVRDALEVLSEEQRQDPTIRRLAGIVAHTRGDWDRARELFIGLADVAAFDAVVGYWLGFMDYLAGNLETAESWLARGRDRGRPEAEAAMCRAMMATIHWLRGDLAAGTTMAEDALDDATRCGAPRALAAAHTVLALLAASTGDRRANDAHYRRALEHAERAGDVLQQARIRSNRGSLFLEEGRVEQALPELEMASQLANVLGFAPFQALVLSNRAEALRRLGRLDEAYDLAVAAIDHADLLGSRLAAHPLTEKARIHALRGERQAAIATYRQAIAVADEAGAIHSLVPALAGLAELLVDDDPDDAAALITRARRHPEDLAVVAVHVTAARVALAADQRLEARRAVDTATPLARQRRDLAGEAMLLELRAELDQDPGLADDAVERWTAIGDPVGLARARLVRARLGDPGYAAEVAAEVRDRLGAIGCRSLDQQIGDLLAGASDQVPVRIEVFGTFRVRRDGRVVDRSGWQSRKARDLVRMLVAARGGPTPREQLIASLWPDSDPSDSTAGNRLKVLVSTLRGVLDPDRRFPSDQFVVTDDGGVRLELAHVEVDVEEMLAQTRQARKLDHQGRGAEALAHWRAAEAAYRGEVFQDDPYAEWATSLREESRQAYVEAARAVAGAEDTAGRPDRAVPYWLRLLDHDRYDERAHLELVRTLTRDGQHGAARRRYAIYVERMRELDLEPTPFPT